MPPVRTEDLRSTHSQTELAPRDICTLPNLELADEEQEDAPELIAIKIWKMFLSGYQSPILYATRTGTRVTQRPQSY